MYKCLWYILGLIVLSSCSANKFLPEGKRYFEGHELVYIDKTSELPAYLKNTLGSDLRPDPTRRFLVSRPGTWIYEVFGNPDKEKGVSNWIKNKLGNPPAYLEDVNIEKNASIVESKLKSNGFFRAEVTTEVDSSMHKATVVYRILLNDPYYIDSLFICDEPIDLCHGIEEALEKRSTLNEGDLFRNSGLEEQREIVANYFRNRGRYYFNPDFAYFQADSNDGSHTVKLKMGMKDNIPESATAQYYLKSATINLAAGSQNTDTIGDSLRVIIDPDKLTLNLSKIRPFIELEPGKLYNKRAETLTLKQLNRLEVFDFVNIQYITDTTGGEYILHAKLLANPRPKQSVRAEFNLSTTSTNFTGPGLQLEYFNRNLFKGAEKFRFTATGRYERQFSGSNRGLTSYELDLMATLLIPRVSGPISRTASKGNVPSTKYRLQYRLYSQPDYYAQSNFGASFGYEWLDGRTTFHDLRLINVDYIRLLQSSDRLEQLFQDNILSRESFDDQLIFGPSYAFTYSPATNREKMLRFFFSGSLEFSGNILYGGAELLNAEKDASGQYNVISVPFAQYARTLLDFRTYFTLNRYNQFVFRQNIGIGVPYLNSSVLPFAKQFFVGGASSLRGFQIRSIGPGTYRNQDGTENSFFDQTGDLLIEWNFENRFDMGGFFEGAVFLDAGNVWLKNPSETRPGGDFQFKDFLTELAVSGGVGLRIDLEFVLVRFDLAIPLRIPSRPQGDRWVVDQISIDKDWRDDNLLLNVAIGYPF